MTIAARAHDGPHKVLLVVHQETSTPGRIGHKLARRGYSLDIRRPCMGQTLPEDLTDYAGVVVFGGPMSANDCSQLDFIRYEIDWIGRPLNQGCPTSASVWARRCWPGISAERYRRTRKAGPRSGITRSVRPIMVMPLGPGRSRSITGIARVFHCPRCVLLAEGNEFPQPAMRYGETAFGIQFHPE